MNVPDSGKSSEQALMEFLMDIECLDSLLPWSRGLNFFDVLRITKTEIRHSNMLAWLLKPNGSHGLQDLFLRSIFQHLITIVSSEAPDVFKVLMMDYESFEINREWNHIDLLAVSEAEKVLLCIENKVDSTEGRDQLTQYHETVAQEFPDYAKLFVYLTPFGDDCSTPDIWQSVSYGKLMELLEVCVVRSELPAENQMMIEHYIQAVRRDIVDDEKLIKVCRQIYEKHHQALDLIYENRLDVASTAFDAIKEWCEQKNRENVICYDSTYSRKRLIRFTTQALSDIMPEHPTPVGEWKAKTMYFYEITNYDKVGLVLVLSSAGMDDKQIEVSNRLIRLMKLKVKKDDWQWKTLKSWGPHNLRDPYSEGYKESLHARLDELLIKALNDE